MTFSELQPAGTMSSEDFYGWIRCGAETGFNVAALLRQEAEKRKLNVVCVPPQDHPRQYLDSLSVDTPFGPRVIVLVQQKRSRNRR